MTARAPCPTVCLAPHQFIFNSAAETEISACHFFDQNLEKACDLTMIKSQNTKLQNSVRLCKVLCGLISSTATLPLSCSPFSDIGLLVFPQTLQDHSSLGTWHLLFPPAELLFQIPLQFTPSPPHILIQIIL